MAQRMDMMKEIITSTKEIDFGSYGYRSYRIEEKNENGFHYQRHIWTTDEGQVDKEDWIMTGRTK